MFVSGAALQKEFSSVGSRTRKRRGQLVFAGRAPCATRHEKATSNMAGGLPGSKFQGMQTCSLCPDQPHPNRRNAARLVPILRPAAADETVPRDDRGDNNPFPLCRKTH